ncbi:MAG: hypothetical protein LBN31_15475 [Hungatella sp.]|jgi:hypothetical protein|nr:hypothetical protein [Hungatella sp.]
MDIENIIKTVLNIPVIELSQPILPPCATWYKLFEEPELSGDGEVTEESETYEINIWGKAREDVINKTGLLKKSLIGIKYNTFPNVTYSYDTNGKSWRGMINFKHMKEDTDVV